MLPLQLKYNVPAWIALILAVGGCFWALFCLPFTVLSFFDSSMWGGSLLFLSGYAVFFWWISRWRRTPSLRAALIWWSGSIALNVIFFCMSGARIPNKSDDALSWAAPAWWILAVSLSSVALILELCLVRKRTDGKRIA